MLRFKHLHYGSLFKQGGKGRHYIHKAKKAQQGGAMGFDGVDYPDPSSYNYLDDKDYNTMLRYIKGMYKIISKQPEADSNKWIKGLIEDYQELEAGGFDSGDVSQTYTDWQGYFTEDSYKGDLVVPEKAKTASKATVKKEKVVVSEEGKKKIEDKISAKMLHYKIIIDATSKKFMALKGQTRTPAINKEMLALKERNDAARKKYEYWKKRMHNVNPNQITDALNNQVKVCREDLKEVKDELEVARASNTYLASRLKSCLDSKDPEKLKAVKKETISSSASLKVPEPKPIEKPVDIDAELARLDVMKKTLVSPSLSSYTMQELKAIAKKEKIIGITGLKKKQLVQLIIDGRNSKKKSEPVKKSVPAKKSMPEPVDEIDEIIANVAGPATSSDIKKDPIYINNTVLELKAKCKELGLTNYGHKNKEQLAMMVKTKAQLPKVSKKQKGSGKNMEDGSEFWQKAI
jgi:hypothetical protein